MIVSKTFILGDLHFGMRKNSKVFQDILMKELNWFKDKVSKKDSVVILGDIFDSRSNIDFNILNEAWNFFIGLSRACKEIYILAGNHDEYYKDFSREHTNCRFLEFEPGSDSKIATVKVITELSTIEINNQKCLFIPWIDTFEKLTLAKDAIKGDHEVIFGHFDTIGLYSNTDSESIPLSFKVPDDFPDGKIIASGHFHKRLKRENVNYVGSFINSTFNDLDEVKGFHILNKNGLEFIENNCPTFRYLTVENPILFINAFKKFTEKDKEEFGKTIKNNFIKLFLNEYKKENDDVYNLIKSMEPKDILVEFNRPKYITNKEPSNFEGFDNKIDIVVFLQEYLEANKEKIPDGVSIDSIKQLINVKNQEYQQACIL